jgi:hypothetical protein
VGVLTHTPYATHAGIRTGVRSTNPYRSASPRTSRSPTNPIGKTDRVPQLRLWA